MPKSYPDTFDIVILGGGFAGVYAARTLERELRRIRQNATIAIVSDENHMVFQPMLPEVAGATLSPRHVVNPIRSLCRKAKVFKAEVAALDIDEKTLTLNAGNFVGSLDLRFRQLAVCVGAKIDLSRIPGMLEHALLLQNVGDAMRIRAHFIGRLEEANLAFDLDTRKRLLSFVIVGGGYSGVETAGQLIDLAKAISRQYKNLRWEDFRFSLIHSRDHLLPTLHKSLGRYTETQLRKRGIEIRLERRAKAVTANRVYLDDGSSIESNTVICTVGNAPHPIIQSLNTVNGLPVEQGRLVVQSDCSVDGKPWLWAAGDCASVPQSDGSPSPPTAQFAQRQGELMGRNIARRLADLPTKTFAFKAIGELASIGHHSAVAEIKGLRFSGLFAWWLWRSIYLLKLPGLERKLRVLFDWTLELFFPRDINLLNPRYSTEVSETHLEAGDTLYQKGDPAFSFYIVKSGSIELRDDGERINVIHANQHFGERALLEKSSYLFHAIALEPTTLVTIRSSVFEQMVQSDAAFSNFLKQSASTYLTSDELDDLLNRLPEHRLESSVSESMSQSLFTIASSSSIEEAMTLFKANSKNYLPILDPSGIPLGSLRKETLYMQLLTSDLDRSQSIDTLPKIQLPQIDQDATLREALTLMTRSNASKALATDNAGKLVGVIAMIDILEKT
ncbi:MAG: NADH dehydrogenase [Candidatus Pelagisphaera sp.]|jgi:NADH dehydrogenase